MTKIFVVSLADAPLNDGLIAGRVRSISDNTETVVTDAEGLLAALTKVNGVVDDHFADT